MHECLHIFGKLPHKGQVKLTLCFRLYKVHGHKKANIAPPLEQQKDNFCITDEKENYWNSLGASF